MKKIQRKSTVAKKIIVFVLVLVAVLVAFTGFAYAANIWPFNNSTVPTSDTQNNNSQENATKDGNPSSEDTPTKTTDQIPLNNSVVVTIDELAQSNGLITFKATVASSIQGGKCSLSLTNPNDKPVTRTVNATSSNSTQICGPIEISEQEFSYLGEWTATLRYYINDTQALATKAITIK